jgi:hypothetical protein
MKTKTLFPFLLICLLFFSSGHLKAQTNSGSAVTPNKTIVIKHPGANDVNAFFSSNTVLSFEVYKPGELTPLINALKKDGNVENCTAGTLTGDYQQFTVSLKSAKDKAWFVALFQKAGLGHIKINNKPVTEVGKI